MSLVKELIENLATEMCIDMADVTDEMLANAFYCEVCEMWSTFTAEDSQVWCFCN